MMKVINLFGGPGCGKSTTASGIFYRLKSSGYKCELVGEYAKDLTYSGSSEIDIQICLLAEQYRRLKILEDHVDIAICDSPLMLSALYGSGVFASEEFKALVVKLHGEFTNHNYLLSRVKNYEEYGRSQTEQEAKKIDEAVESVLVEYLVPFLKVFKESCPIEVVLRGLAL